MDPLESEDGNANNSTNCLEKRGWDHGFVERKKESFFPGLGRRKIG
jgi:hypothetical protein